MGILDEIVGGLAGNAGGGSGMQGMLMNMLGGNQQQGGMQPQGAQGTGGMPGGLGGLMASFEQAGLGHVMQSWVGNGANLPVSPEQLQGVLGPQQVQTMASQSGMAAPDFLSQLAQHLPHAVNSMTPNGQLPQEGGMSV